MLQLHCIVSNSRDCQHCDLPFFLFQVADDDPSQTSQIKSDGVKRPESGSTQSAVMKNGQTAGPSTGTCNEKASTSATDQKQDAANKSTTLLDCLMKLTPKELMNEIVGGRVPVSLLDRVSARLPAEMLQEAVDFLTKPAPPGGQTGSEKLADNKPCTGEGDNVGALKKDAPGVQAVKPAVLQSIKSASSSTTTTSQSSGASDKALTSNAGNTSTSVATPSKGPAKRKLEGLDASKVRFIVMPDSSSCSCLFVWC